MLYYDPFDVNEEEDFFESERQESQQQVQQYLQRIKKHHLSTETALSNPFTHVLTEIQLTLPLEQESLVSLMHAIQESSHVKRLLLSHWGLGDNGVVWVLPLLDKITHLGLTNCGITARGFHQLLSTMSSQNNDLEQRSSSLESLDISRNHLLRVAYEGHRRLPSCSKSSPTILIHPQNPSSFLYQSSPRDLLCHTLVNILPHCASLRKLNLSATGLHTNELMDAVWQGVCHNSSDCTLQSLDVSQNFDSLISLLESILPYLSTMSSSLHCIVLTRGVSSSTCLDGSSSTTTLPILAQLLQQMRHNYSLHQFGPLSILPLDRLVSEDIQLVHTHNTSLLDDVKWYYLRRNRIRQYLFYPTTGSDTSSHSSHTPKSSDASATLSLLLAQMVGSLQRLPMNGDPSLLPNDMATYRHSHSLVYWILQEMSSQLWARGLNGTIY